MKVTTVQKAQKDSKQNCIGCHEPIRKGEGYAWCAAFRGPKRVKHLRCGPFKASEREANEKMATLYAIQEQGIEWLPDNLIGSEASLDDVKAMLESLADDAEAVAEEYEESASNIEDGFGHETEQSMEATEKAEEIRSWAEEIRSAADQINEWDPESDDDLHLGNFGGDIEQQARALMAAYNEWASEIADVVEEVLNGLSL